MTSKILIFDIYDSELLMDNVKFDKISFLSLQSSSQSNVVISNSELQNITRIGTSIDTIKTSWNSTTSTLGAVFNLLNDSNIMLDNVLIENIQIIGDDSNVNQLINVGKNCKFNCIDCRVFSGIYKTTDLSIATKKQMINCAGDNGIYFYKQSN